MSTWEALKEKTNGLDVFLEDWQQLETALSQEPVWQARHTDLIEEPDKTAVLAAASQFIVAKETLLPFREVVQTIHTQVASTQQELDQDLVLSATTQVRVNQMNALADLTLQGAEELRSTLMTVLNTVRAATMQPRVGPSLR